MVQNILALIIVFSAAAISIFSIVRSLTSKKGGHCDGCTACGPADIGKHEKRDKSNIQKVNYKNLVLDNKQN